MGIVGWVGDGRVNPRIHGATYVPESVGGILSAEHLYYDGAVFHVRW